MPAPVCVPAAPCPVQIPANSLRKATTGDDTSAFPPEPTWEIQMKLLALAWPSWDLYSQLGSEPVNEKHSHSPSLSLFLPFYKNEWSNT